MYELISEKASKVESSFQNRLNFLMDIYDTNAQELACYLRETFPHHRFTSRTVYSWFDNGSYGQRIEFAVIKALCNRFHVSSDYLLGISDKFNVTVKVRKKR